MRVDEELASLVRVRGQHLVRVAYQLSHDASTAEDIVQEALLQVCRSWRARHGGPEHLEAYVRRAMVNVYLKRRRSEPDTQPWDEHAEQRPDGSAFDTRYADRDELWNQLELLPARQRAVLVLRFYEGLPDPEIAAVLGCRRASVRSLAARGLAALRSQVDQVPVPVARKGRS